MLAPPLTGARTIRRLLRTFSSAEAEGADLIPALVRRAPRVDRLAATRPLERSGAAVQRVGRPDRIVNLAPVDAFSSAVAAFLVLVAAIAAGHALVTSVRHRATNLAVLKAIGFASRAWASVA